MTSKNIGRLLITRVVQLVFLIIFNEYEIKALTKISRNSGLN